MTENSSAVAAAIHQPGMRAPPALARREVLVGGEFGDEAGGQRQHPELSEEDESDDDEDQQDGGKDSFHEASSRIHASRRKLRAQCSRRDEWLCRARRLRDCGVSLITRPSFAAIRRSFGTKFRCNGVTLPENIQRYFASYYLRPCSPASQPK